MRSKGNILITDGSLTVETAMVLPIFLISFMALLAMIRADAVRIGMLADIHREAVILSAEGYSGESHSTADILDHIIADTEHSSLRRNIIADCNLDGSGIDDPEITDLVINYDIEPLFGIPGVGNFPVTQRNLLHSWTGYINGYIPSASDTEYVYITEDSEVYHRSRECTHIRLSITATTPDEVVKQRNEDGGKYHSCELCHSSLADGLMYITRDGDRYHNTLNCSGLKRSVRAIPITEAGTRRPCQRCGY